MTGPKLAAAAIAGLITVVLFSAAVVRLEHRNSDGNVPAVDRARMDAVVIDASGSDLAEFCALSFTNGGAKTMAVTLDKTGDFDTNGDRLVRYFRTEWCDR